MILVDDNHIVESVDIVRYHENDYLVFQSAQEFIAYYIGQSAPIYVDHAESLFSILDELSLNWRPDFIMYDNEYWLLAIYYGARCVFQFLIPNELRDVILLYLY